VNEKYKAFEMNKILKFLALNVLLPIKGLSFGNTAFVAMTFISVFLVLTSCTKLVTIPPPTNSITTEETFADSADANAAVLGIYSSLAFTGQNLSVGDGGISLYCGLSSDELVPFNPYSDQLQMYTNTVLSTNGAAEGIFWSPAYKVIYQANACIAGIQSSAGLTSQTQTYLIGEAKFIRALLDFYLVNLFGSVPLVNSTDYSATALYKRSSVSDVYKSIVSDLIAAQSSLPPDYSLSNGDRTRANKWAATALLARVYLYMGDYMDAQMQADSVIGNTGLFGLVTTLSNVFLMDSPESILQWNMNLSNFPYNVTTEGYNIIPRNSTSFPLYYLSPELLNSFEPNDSRWSSWVDSTVYNGTTYYFPYKYELGRYQIQTSGSITELYTVLRLAEQYLIRAEAEANGANGGTTAAIMDLNTIRNRAGLPPYQGATDKVSVLTAIYHERQIELFVEWGHRWLDLKRTGMVDNVMSIVTPQKLGGQAWNSYQQLYPIPQFELSVDPNLTQNPGYQ